MSSITEAEISLPVDFNGSANPDELPEVTFGAHLEYPDGSVPKVAKSSSGRMSPVRARTMKDYDQQIADLKKENFSLKLRIFYMEERIQQQFGSGEDLFKLNIELKVENESLKKEAVEKQELLLKASTALDSLTKEHQKKLEETQEKAAKEAAGEVSKLVEQKTQEHEEMIASLQNQLTRKQEEFEDQQLQLEESQKQLQKVVMVSKELDKAYKELRQSNDELKQQAEEGLHAQAMSPKINEDELLEKDRLIEQLRNALKTKELIIEQQEEEKKDAVKDGIRDAVKDAENQLQQLKLEMSAKNHQIQDLQNQLQSEIKSSVDEESVSESLTESYSARPVHQLEQELKDKENMIGRLEDFIRDKEGALKDLKDQHDKLEEENHLHTENALKRDKAIQGLTQLLQEKAIEAQSLSERIENKDAELTKAQESLHQLKMEKYKSLEDLQRQDMDRDNKVSELENDLRDRKLEVERLHKALSRREGELERVSSQLEKADEVLRNREEALQRTRDQYQDETKHSSEKADLLEQHYQALLEDGQRRLQSQEKMLQRQTASLQDKDKQLAEYMEILKEQQPGTEEKESLICSLRDRVKDREKAVETAAEEKYKALEEKDNEIRQLKTALRERDRDIEKANQMLLSTEESMDTLEIELKEKEQALQQTSATIKTQQQSLQEATNSHARALEEKESVISTLQQSLAIKDKNLKDVIRQSPNTSDVLVQQLQQRLQEKEQLLQDMLVDRGKAAEASSVALKELRDKLDALEQERQEECAQKRQQVAALNQDLQGLRAELNQKDYQLQMVENRATWTEDQQQELLDRLRTGLNEKEKTIQALLESAAEKDRLLRQMKDATPESQQHEATKMADLHRLKEQLARLQNELQKKDSLIEQLRDAVERKSPKGDQQAQRQLEEAKAELAKKTDALTRALRAEQLAKKELNEYRRYQSDTDPSEVSQLRQQIAELTDKLERPGTPQRAQTSIGAENNPQLQQLLADQLNENQDLNTALGTEASIFRNLNRTLNADPSDPLGLVQTELANVQRLRKQLEDGISHNNQMRAALEQQLRQKGRTSTSPAGTGSVTDLLQKIHSLQTQLEEALRWNQSLQARLSQPPTQRGGGVGKAKDSSSAMPANKENLRKSDANLMSGDSHLPNGLSQTMESVVTPHLINGLNNSNLSDQMYNSQTMLGDHSYLPSFYSVPELEDIPSELEVSNMDSDQLQELGQKLREQLIKAMQEIENLNQQLLSKSHPPSNLQDGLENAFRDLQDKLLTSERQNAKLRGQLDKILNSPKSGHDVRIIPVLKEQLKETQEKLKQAQGKDRSLTHSSQAEVSLSDRETEHLKKQLAKADKVISLLKKQIELNTQTENAPSGFNPELIVQMAQEIEKLKEQTQKKQQPDVSEKSKVPTKPPGGSQRSQIPTLQKDVYISHKKSADAQAQQALQKQIESLKSDLSDAKVQNKHLEGVLAATEATVRSQAERMKTYRGVLEDAGLLQKSPVRSHSLSNLSALDSPARGNTPVVQRCVSASTEMLQNLREPPMSPSPTFRGLNLSQFSDYGKGIDASELQDQVHHLKSYLGKASHMIHSLKERLHQAQIQASVHQADTEGYRPVQDGSKRGQDGSDSLPPDWEKTKATNREMFAELQAQVEDLKRQLHETQDLNATLQEQLKRCSPQQSPGISMLDKQDSVKARKHVSQTHNRCEQLGQQLGQLSQLLDQLMHQNEEGEVDILDVTPRRVSEFKQQLLQARGIAQELAADLQGEESNLAAPGEEAASKKKDDLERRTSEALRGMSEFVQLQDKYREASEQIQLLEGQLAQLEAEQGHKDSLDEESLAKQKVYEELQQRCEQAISENETLQKQWEALEQENEGLQKTIDEITEKNNFLQEENNTTSAAKDELKKTCELVTHDNDALRQAVEEREEEMEKLEVQNVQLKQVALALEEENAQLKNGFTKKEAQMSDLQESYDKLDENLREKDRVNTELQNLCKQNQDALSEKDKINMQLQQSLNAQKRSHNQLQKENDQLQRSHDQLQKSHDQLKMSYDQLKASLDNQSQQLHTAKDQQQHVVIAKDRLISELQKELLENQEVARQLKDDLSKCAVEIEEKNKSLSHQRKKIQDLQDQLAQKDQPFEVQEAPMVATMVQEAFQPREGRDSIESIERQRHATAGSQPSLFQTNHLFTSPEDDFPDHGLYRLSGGKTPELNGLNGFDQLHPFRNGLDAPDGAAIEPAIAPVQQVAPGVAPQNSSLLNQTQNGDPSPSRLSRQDQVDLIGSPDVSSTATGSPDTPDSSLVVEHLRNRLQATEDLNQTLLTEVKVYQNLCLQADTSVTWPADGKTLQRSDGVPLSVQEHLEEMRALRERLQESLAKNDRLMRQLEGRLVAPPKGGSPVPRDSVDGHQMAAGDADALLHQLAVQRQQLDDLSLHNRELKDALDQVRLTKQQLQQSERRLTDDLQRKTDQLRTAQKENRRLRDEISALKEQLQEQKELNRTLRAELDISSRLSQRSGVQDSAGDDMTLLLQEMRALRDVLEKTISKNTELRRKLQQLMSYSPTPSRSDAHLNGWTSPIEGGTYTDRQERFAHRLGDVGMSPMTRLDTSPIASPQNLMDADRTSHSPPTRLHESPSSRVTDLRGQPADQMNLLPEHSVGLGTESDLGSRTVIRRNLFDAQRDNMDAGKDVRTDGSMMYPTRQQSPAGKTSHLDSMTYSALDTQRPPRTVVTGGEPYTHPHASQGAVEGRIGADLRLLYAIGALDDYELLKKQISESLTQLRGLEMKLQGRLNLYSLPQSTTYNSIKDMSVIAENIKLCLKEQQRLIGQFWLSQLPKNSGSGEPYDFRKVLEENLTLKKEILAVKKQVEKAGNKTKVMLHDREDFNRQLLSDLRVSHRQCQQARMNLEAYRQVSLSSQRSSARSSPSVH